MACGSVDGRTNRPESIRAKKSPPGRAEDVRARSGAPRANRGRPASWTKILI
jgi:hypothetical protein